MPNPPHFSQNVFCQNNCCQKSFIQTLAKQPKTSQQNIMAWLTATGSLTQKLEKLAGQKLIVKPTFEGRTSLTLAEKKQLGLPKSRSQSAWVRTSLLFGRDGKAWVSARSVFVLKDLTGQARQLANLGGRPIGYVIFGRKKAVLKQRWYAQTADGWQRTSLYEWQGKKLLISECFLFNFFETL
ncbi:chorismate--pyruvate lyase family protein [Faucicola mancuniensis]|uniref:chorismate--pyruvate lyase family protein n=1 Tax=Faucicola mancuniensis TaxID=1309795 RepID=UPI0039776163